jgi:hypothetical protein
VCACYLEPRAAKIAVQKAKVWYASASSSGTTELSLSLGSEAAVKGVQLEFETGNDVQITGVQSNIEGMDVFSGTVDGLFKVGLLDMTGKAAIPAGQHDVVTINYASTSSARTEDGEIKLVNAIVVGEDASEMNVTIKSVGAVSSNDALPSVRALSQNIPNPFNPTTEIAYSIPKSTQVKLEVLNILGQSVRTLVDDYKVAGNYSVIWDGRDNSQHSVASGIYLYRIAAGEYSETRKMVLMK